MRYREPHQVKDRAEIDIHHLIPELERCVFDSTRLQNTGGVHQHIETAKRVYLFGDCALGFFLVREIRNDCKTISGIGTRDFIQRALASSNKRDTSAMSQK